MFHNWICTLCHDHKEERLGGDATMPAAIVRAGV